MNHKLVWVLCGLMLLFFMGLVGCVAKAPVPVKTWQKVTEFTGDSSEESESFKIDAGVTQWRVDYSTKLGDTSDLNFSANVIDKNNSYAGLIADVSGANSNTTYIKGAKAGTYTIEIITNQSYSIDVEELK